MALVGILCGAAGATVTASQMARKTAGLEEFDFFRVQVKQIRQSLAEKPTTTTPKKLHDLMLDHLKLHVDNLIQKSRSIGKKENEQSSTEEQELVASTNKDNHTQLEEGDNGKNGEEIVEVAFTEHSHGENRQSRQEPIGIHSTYKGLHVIVGIPGWANSDKEECVCDVWARTLHGINSN